MVILFLSERADIMTKIVDDVFNNITVDVEKVQTKPTMYISYVGSRATMHLTREIINNSIDEIENPHSISDGLIKVFYVESENMIYVEDTGRGIPFDELENACTILHSGTKMDRKYGNTAGENGVGLTATNALSEIFEITSFRDGHMKYIQFKEGIKSVERTAKCSSNKHGLLVAFKPSRLYLGANCQLPEDELVDWLTKLSFNMPERVKIKLTFSKSGKDATSEKIFQNTKGIGGFLAKLEPSSNLLKTPIVLIKNTTIMEKDIPTKGENGEITLIDMERDIDLKVAINFNPDSQDTVKYSFCNNIENIEHGEHMNGAIAAILSFFKRKVKEADKKDDIEVTNNDILFGLSVVINMGTNYSTGLFTSQTKHKMDNRIFYEPVRKTILSALDEYFKLPENKRILTRVVQHIKTNIKVRLAATKARKAVKTNRTSFMESTNIANYNAPNFLDVPGAKLELYIVEGDSAAGTARAGRFDPNIQGTYGLTGKPSNGYGESPSFVEKKAEDLKRLFVDILGCGYGPNFNIDNLVYDKIILMPDADVDGHHIMGLLVADIYQFARPLIEQGKVYRAITPLYRMRERVNAKRVTRNDYLYTKDEFFDAYEKQASEVIKLKFNQDDDDFISRANMKRFLQTNRDYFQWLDTMSHHYTLNPNIIEFMAYHSEDFRERIHECSPELTYDKDNDSIQGIYNGSFYNIILDNIFVEKLKYLTDVIDVGNDGILYYHTYKMNKSRAVTYQGYLSIGQIMKLCQDQEPDLSARYKGQGELGVNEMNELVMNPNNRLLLQMTINDVETTTGIMDDLFLDERRGVRKQMIQDAIITVDDIDN